MKIDRQKLLSRARRLGADVTGVARMEPLVEAGAILHEPLEGARSAIVLGARQSFAALGSPLVQMAQHDTTYAYARVDEASHALVRVLEDAGHAAVAVPSFLPIDMGDESGKSSAPSVATVWKHARRARSSNRARPTSEHAGAPSSNTASAGPCGSDSNGSRRMNARRPNS
jgi:hypothetical protein